MTTLQTATITPPTSARPTDPLLWGAVLAAPLFATVSLTQAATRAGFDLTRHPLSALSTGDLGWLQIANFLVTGALTLLGALGLHHALRATPGGRWAPRLVATPGGRWAPRLVATAGIGLMAAGVLVMDPADGFPLGTPSGRPTTMSWHSYGHLAAGSISFAALIAACYVLGHHFSRGGDRPYAVASRIAGTALVLGDGWAMTGGRAGALTLAVGAITAMLWISVVAGRLRRGTRKGSYLYGQPQ